MSFLRNLVDKFRGRVHGLPLPVAFTSTKGGVGKTLNCANTALKLSEMGKRVGVIDCDIESPTLARYFGIMGQDTKTDVNTRMMEPITFRNIKIQSMATFLMNEPRRFCYFDGETIQNFLIDLILSTNWGKLDVLIADAPPTLSDEIIALKKIFRKFGGVIIVGTPERQTLDGAERSLNFYKQQGIKILGLVENMSGSESACCHAPMVCKHCGDEVIPYAGHGLKGLAQRYNVPFLGSLPFNPLFAQNNSSHKHFIHNDYKVFERCAEAILQKRR